MDFDSIIKMAFHGKYASTVQDMLMRVAATLVFCIFLIITRRIFLRFILSKRHDRLIVRRWQRGTGYILIMLAIVSLIPIWLPSIRGVLAVLGFFGAGFLIVMKEVIMSIVGWFYIVVRSPFTPGDRIEIGGHFGDVIDIRLLEFSMVEVKSRSEGGLSTGRVLHMPNSLLITNPMANASKEFSFNWNEIKIYLTIQSDWKKAIEIIKKIAARSIEKISSDDKRIKKSEEEYLIRYRNLEPGIFVDVTPGSIVLTLRHLVEPRQTRTMTDLMWREILIAFKKNKTIWLKE